MTAIRILIHLLFVTSLALLVVPLTLLVFILMGINIVSRAITEYPAEALLRFNEGCAHLALLSRAKFVR